MPATVDSQMHAHVFSVFIILTGIRWRKPTRRNYQNWFFLHGCCIYWFGIILKVFKKMTFETNFQSMYMQYNNVRWGLPPSKHELHSDWFLWWETHQQISSRVSPECPIRPNFVVFGPLLTYTEAAFYDPRILDTLIINDSNMVSNNSAYLRRYHSFNSMHLTLPNSIQKP